MTHDFAAQHTELLALVFAAHAAEARGETEAAIALNELLVISAASLETDLVLAQDDIEAARLN
jgi:hypothetical protein